MARTRRSPRWNPNRYARSGNTNATGNARSAPVSSATETGNEADGAKLSSEERLEKMRAIQENAKRHREQFEKEENQRKKKAKKKHGFDVWNNQPNGTNGSVKQTASPKAPLLYGRRMQIRVELFCVGEYIDKKRKNMFLKLTKLKKGQH